jgi:hypothetical protein
MLPSARGKVRWEMTAVPLMGVTPLAYKQHVCLYRTREHTDDLMDSGQNECEDDRATYSLPNCVMRWNTGHLLWLGDRMKLMKRILSDAIDDDSLSSRWC